MPSQATQVYASVFRYVLSHFQPLIIETGDETIPTCDRCRRGKLYCDRNSTPRPLLATTRTATAPDVDGALPALQDHGIARLFNHYIQHLGPWYDLSDDKRHFTRVVPQEALHSPLLFNAIIAFAAVHCSRTGIAGLRPIAEQYHALCVELIIALDDVAIQSDRGTALAAVCLLRSYEILAEDSDPNRHLAGAYALAAGRSVTGACPSLVSAGFFNYLREDITFSLINRTPLKLDTTVYATHDLAAEQTAHTNGSTAENYLNLVTLILADTINLAFRDGQVDSFRAKMLENRLQCWVDALPARSRPYYTEDSQVDGEALPRIYMFSDAHVAIRQYHIVISSIMMAYTKDEHARCNNTADQLARELCGLAFTSGIQSVLVNSYGPIAYCGAQLRSQGMQVELVKRLIASCKATGWPVQRIVRDLELCWAQKGHLG